MRAGWGWDKINPLIRTRDGQSLGSHSKVVHFGLSFLLLEMDMGPPPFLSYAWGREEGMRADFGWVGFYVV